MKANASRPLMKRHYRTIIKLGIPIMIGQMGIILVGFADNMMVGHHSTDELAAASFVNNFMSLVFIMGIGFSYGLTPLVSSSYAMGDGRLRGLLKSSLMANAIVGVAMTLAMGFVLWKIEWLNQPDELLPLIVPYYLLQLSSIIITMLFNAFKQYADGTDNASTPMKVMLASNAINIVLNYFLIFGHAGLPELGLIGAGISTLIARVFCLIVLMTIIRRSDKFKQLKETDGTPHKGSPQRYTPQLFRLGLPLALQMGVEAASFSLAVIMVGWLGSVALAAHQIMSVISTLGFMLYYGLGAAVTIRLSRYYEQRDTVNMRAVVRAGFHLLALMAGGYVLFLLTCKSVIGYLFTPDQELIHLVEILCPAIAAYQLGDLMQVLYANALRGLRDVRFMAISAVVCHIVIALSVAYYLGFKFHGGLGIEGIWMTFTVSLTSLGGLLCYRYHQVMKKLEA